MSEIEEKSTSDEDGEKNNSSKVSENSVSLKKSHKLVFFGLVGLSFVLIIVLSVLATLLLSGKSDSSLQKTQVLSKNSVVKKEVKKEEKKEEPPKGHEESSSKEEGASAGTHAPEFYQVRPSIVITLPASGRTRYVSLDIDLMTHNKSSIKTLETYGPLIKSNLIDLLSKQSFDEINTEEGKKKLKNDALTSLQTLMNEQAGDPIVEQVLFTSFIVQ